MNSALELQVSGNLVEVKVTGKLSHENYMVFVPEIEKVIKLHGKVRVLFIMHDFHGWTAGALWDDMKFEWKHGGDIERLAIVGETKWEQGMASFCKPFTSAKIQYFDTTKLDEARAWILEA